MEEIVIQKFPFKTVSMLASFLGNVAFSYLAKYLFESGKISHKYDFLDAVVSKDSGEIMDKTTLVTRGNNIGLSEMVSVKPRLSVTLAAAFTRRDTLPKETVEEEEELSSPDSSHHDEEWHGQSGDEGTAQTNNQEEGFESRLWHLDNRQIISQ